MARLCVALCMLIIIPNLSKIVNLKSKNVDISSSKKIPILVTKTKQQELPKQNLNKLSNNNNDNECITSKPIDGCTLNVGDTCNIDNNKCCSGECTIDFLKNTFKCCNTPCNTCNKDNDCCYGKCNSNKHCCSLLNDPCQNKQDCCSGLDCAPIDGTNICIEINNPIWPQIVIPPLTPSPTVLTTTIKPTNTPTEYIKTSTTKSGNVNDCILKVYRDCNYIGTKLSLNIGKYNINQLSSFININDGFSWILEGNKNCCIHINDNILGDILFDGFNQAWTHMKCTKKRFLWNINYIDVKIDDICEIYNDITSSTYEPYFWESTTTTTTQHPWFSHKNNRKQKQKNIKPKKISKNNNKNIWHKTKNNLLSNNN